MNQLRCFQSLSLTDPDGVTTFYGYNGRGERSTTILEIDSDGVLDMETDRVTETTSSNPGRWGSISRLLKRQFPSNRQFPSYWISWTA